MADERHGINLPPPPNRATRRSRRWVVVLVIAAVLVGLALVGTVVFTGPEPDDQAGPQVLLDEDFEGQGPYEFVEEEDAFIRLDVSDGVYDIFIKDASLGQPVTHTFIGEFEAIRFEATVTQTTRAGFTTFFSIGCWDGTTMYGLTLTSDRWLFMSQVEMDSVGRSLLEGPIHHPAVRAAGQANTVRIDCASASGGRPAAISGWVNGTPILTHEVPNGPASFERVGFLIKTVGDGTEFRVDDVTAFASRFAAPTVVPPDDLPWGSTPQRFERFGIGFSFPPDWVILDGESPDSFSVGPKPEINWVKIAQGPIPFSVTSPRDVRKLLQDFGGRIVSGPAPVEIAGLPAYRVSIRDIELKDGQIVDAELLLFFFRPDTLHLLVCQYKPSARADVLAAWSMARATFHA